MTNRDYMTTSPYGLVQFTLHKNGVIGNATCDHILHDYKIFQWPNFNLKI